MLKVMQQVFHIYNELGNCIMRYSIRISIFQTVVYGKTKVNTVVVGNCDCSTRKPNVDVKYFRKGIVQSGSDSD